MPLEAPLAPPAERAAELNRRFAHHAAAEVLAYALHDPEMGTAALVSSFGAETIVLLHLASVIDRTTPVLFVDTEMLFPETLEYQREVARHLGLTDVRVIRPDREAVFRNDPGNNLHGRDPDACCHLRRTEPLDGALAGFDAWVTGRKRYHGGRRAALDFFEADSGTWIKVNPLAHWSSSDVQDYIGNNRLPRHPLVARGFPSIGCLPCTTRIAPGESLRAGRWRGRDKDECGLHFVEDRMVRKAPGRKPA